MENLDNYGSRLQIRCTNYGPKYQVGFQSLTKSLLIGTLGSHKQKSVEQDEIDVVHDIEPKVWGFNFNVKKGKLISIALRCSSLECYLCFRCNEKFTYGHWCKYRQLRVLVCTKKEEDNSEADKHQGIEDIHWKKPRSNNLYTWLWFLLLIKHSNWKGKLGSRIWSLCWIVELLIILFHKIWINELDLRILSTK